MCTAPKVTIPSDQEANLPTVTDIYVNMRRYRRTGAGDTTAARNSTALAADAEDDPTPNRPEAVL
jgi:hypothetical protein